MDYEGTRDTDTEIALGDTVLNNPALARALPELAAAAGAAARTGGTPLVPDANNTVVLPDGASLDDITVRGRDLVIQTDDGRTYVIADGAVFVPQIVAQGITVPPLNLAALLIGHEPEPAAGAIRSSGGNFAVPVGSIQDAYKIGDLLPYTELKFPEPRVREIFPGVDRKPETGPNADVLLDDDALKGGNPGGTGDDADSANTVGNLVGTGGDGALTWSLSTAGAPSGFSYVANGTGLDVFQGAVRVLTVTLDPATGAYTVTQIAPIVHVAGSDENNQIFTLTYTVTDIDGDTASGTLGINVDDDTPVANPDTDTVAAGTYGPETGNVLTGAGTTSGAAGADHVGADGPAAGGALVAITGFGGAGSIGGTTTGQYGTLTLNADGSYSYVRNPGTPGGVADTFTYTIRDGDGDNTTTTLTINIGDAQPLTRENATVLLDDDALAGGNAGGTGDTVDAANVTGTLAAAGGDGPLVWSLSTGGAPAGFSYVANGTGINVFQGSTLVMQVTLNTATGAYTVTQVAPIDHAAGGDENNQPFNLTYTVTDQDGDAATGTLAISVNDDTPLAANDTDTVVSGTYGPETGNVLTGVGTTSGSAGADSIGADGPAAGGAVTAISGFGGVGAIEGTTIGQYGTLTLHADGSYSYVRNPGTAGGVSDVFTYTVTDHDGDTATATLTIAIEDARPLTTPNALVQLDDDALAGGNPGGTGDVNPDTANTTGTLSGAGGDGPLTWNMTSFTSPVGFAVTLVNPGLLEIRQGGNLVFTITLNNATGGYTVNQVAPIDHAALGDENSSNFILGYRVTDVDGDQAGGSLSININDDTPIAVNDTDALLAGATTTSGNVLTGLGGDGNAAGADSIGADGPATGGAVTAITGFGGAGTIDGTTTGQYGTLTLHADGSYTYVRTGTGPISATDTFTYTITDHDGDTATATLIITLEDAAPITGPNLTVLLDDDAFAGGNPGGIGDVTPDTANTTGTLAASGGDGALAWAMTSFSSPAGFNATLVNPGLLEIRQGTTLVMSVTLNTATGAYTVTQVAPIDHAALGDENNSSFTLGYGVTDADGDQAFGTLSISVNDDTPIAVNDTDAILGGGTSATGNVLTGLGSDGDPAGADSIGADGPAAGGAVTAVSGFGGAGTIDGTTVGQYGTLTLHADGSYTYVRASGSPGNVADTFTYTITDHDGDTATATLVITIEDARPITGPNALVQLDDDALAGGNPGGIGDVNPDTANTTGTLTGSGGDGALTWQLISFTSPVGYTPTLVNPGLLEVRQGGTLVFTITVNNATGAYTVTQVAPISHPAGGDENNTGFSLGYQVIDADGDTAAGSLAINIDDDTPTVSVTGALPNLTVDETVFGTNSTQNLSSVFTHSFGADGAAVGGGVAYTLGVVAGPSGLVDTLSGEAVNLVLNGAVVEGRTATGGVLVFTVAVDGAGNVTLDQSRAVVHDPNAGPNDVETMAANLVTLTQTVTDRDGDSASATANIGDHLQFVDDAPSAGSNLTVFLNDDALAGGNPGGAGDTGAVQFTTGTLSHNYGNDGGSIAFLTTGAPAGFQYVASGSNVLVQQNQGGSFVTVATVTLNSATGAYTVTQNAPVIHPTSGANEENLSLTLNYVVTDGDGDQAPSALVIVFNDDTPVAVNDTDSVTEDGAIVADGNVFTGTGGSDANATDGVKDSIGADGVALAGPVTAVAFGATTGTIGTALAGTYGSLTLNADGSYSYALNNGSAAVQALDSGETRTEVFTYTITDRDGDSTTATLTVTINGANDAPVVTPSTAAVSEEGLALANPDTVGNTDTTNSATATGQILATDVDVEPLSYTLGTPATALTSGGVAITWTGAGTGTLTGSAGATPIITVTIDANGNYTVTLLGHVDHPSTTTEDALSLVVPVNVSDGTATTPTTLTVSIEDDSPIATTGTTSGTVDEDGLSGGIAGGTGDVPGQAITATGSVVGLFSGGADTAPQYLLTTTAGLPALTSGGTAITYSLVGNVLTGTAGATPIFTLSLNAATGGWTFTLQGPIDHASGANENNLVLNFAGIVQAVDADGDRASATGTFSVTVNDDTPVANNDGATQATENAPVSINVFANDQGGADGALASSVAVVGGSLTGTGSLVNNGNGTFTYTPGAGEQGTVTFAYTITDRDGDTSQATATITLLADSTPQVVNVVAAVDDDALSGGNALSTIGDINANAGEPGATPSEAIYTGAIAVGFGGDTGTVSFANLNGTTGTVGTETVNYAWNALTNTLTATGPRGVLFTVSLTPSGTYTVTLVDNVLHANGGNETSAPVVNLNYVATDSDGDSNSTGVLAITFNDDAPTAVNDGVTQATENAAVTINVFANDAGGADGTAASSTALVAGSLTGTGILLNNGNGTFTYTPGAGETGSVSFQYTITDADGDVSQATATITLLADSTPQVVNVVAAVDDDALAGGIAGGTGDIDANAGEPGATPSEAIYTGGIVVNFGGDTGTVSFANLNGTTGTVGTETVNYAWNAGTNTLTATGPRGVLFTVSLTPSGAYTVTLVDNVLHAAGGNETSTVVNLNYLAADSDGDTNSTGVMAITFNDDTPTLGVVQNQQANNDPTQAPAVGTLHFAAGADGAGSAMTISANLTGITSGGHALVTQQVGNVLTAYADITGNGFTGDDTAVFTLTVDPNAGTSGQYTFNLIAPLDTLTTNVSILSNGAFGSGPSSGIEVTNSATAEKLTLVTGWAATGGFTGGEEGAWLAGGTPDMTQRTDVNGSTSGWGLANNNFDAGEFLRFDFGALNDYDGAGGYTPPAAGPYANVSYAAFSFFNFGSGDKIEFVAHYTNGTTASWTLLGGVDPSTFTINSPSGTQIAWIDVYEATGSIKLNLTDIGVTQTTIDQTLPFTVQLTDGDGDPTATANFSVHVATGLAPLSPALPIAIDLNGDGVHFLGTDAGVTFDYAGDGQKVATAWVDGHDGLLAIDSNHNGSVDNGTEIVFGGNGLTDLQGLAATYDTNHDGMLDAQDAAFAQFGVWQDANSNGVSDAGEFKSLTELGIASINLTSNGQVSTAAGGDVTVLGTTTYTRTDGTTGTATDVAFATSALQRQAQPAELAAVSAAATGLLAAMALDHANAAADTGLRTAAAHTADLPAAPAPVSVDLPETAARPAFAQLASLASAKVAAQAESRGDHTDADRGHAELARIVDHADKIDTAAQTAGKSALFADHDGGHAAMDALLTVAAQAQTKAAPAAQPVVAEALSDAAGNHAVDHIVDHFAATTATQLGASPKAGDFALQGLLDSSVQGSGHDAGAPHFNLMQALDHEQAAALA